MSENTGISWTHSTFNPWWGCQEVSPACAFCYARKFAQRFDSKLWGKDAPRRFFNQAHWDEPLKWNDKAARAGVRRRVFCGSMCDVFEDRRDLDFWRGRLWRLIEETPNLDWLILTKRPENFRSMLFGEWQDDPRSNVWIGVTVENQECADSRIPVLLSIPARVRFVSAEPLLGPLDLSDSLREFIDEDYSDGFVRETSGLDWVIAGAESGPRARPCDEDWMRSLRDQCARKKVPFFLKQLRRRGRIVATPKLDGRRWTQFPSVAGVPA